MTTTAENPAITTRPKIKRQIMLETNFNGKMGCDTFIHLALAPGRGISQTEMDGTVFRVATQDGTHPAIECMMVDLGRFELRNTTSMMAWLSHGMDAPMFIKWMHEKFTGITPTTPMAMYFYCRTKQVENNLP